MTEPLHEGQGVWVPHSSETWVSAEVISESPKGVLVRTEEGDEITVARDKLYIKNPDILEGVPDLSQLSFLHEPGILYNLHHRYKLDLIYTYIGKILIAINPYARLPLYGKDMINAYYNQPLGALAPHAYAIAQDAFKDMRMEGLSQSILVSGESGAGKTETTKVILQYFAAMGNMLKVNGASPKVAPAQDGKTKVQEKSIEEKVLESTPLLEAFGNAKTLRNDNSSRFGKFIEINFDEFGYIIGARIQTYLLEKSRIFRQVQNERNYHAFYQLCAGADDDMRSKLHIGRPDDYFYLNQSGCTEVEDVDDAEEFERTKHAMSISGGLDEKAQYEVFTLLSAVLMLGNISFTKNRDDSSNIKDREPLEKAAELIKCDPNELEKVLLSRKVTAKNDTYIVNMNPDQAANARDSLSMLLYSHMFDWLVVKINESIQQKKKPKSFIGILDIYGFECFDKNSFEQFCINYANEKLQQLFNQHVFKEEQQEYIKEKIDWSYVDFVDNQDTLDLIEKKPVCILSLLDEESTFPKATGLTFATKLYSKLTSHPKFEKPRFGAGAFTVQHYAGKVTYDTEEFLDKNKDFVIPEQMTLLQKCKNTFIQMLVKGNAPQSKDSKDGQQSNFKFTSVGSQFSTSLGVLMKTICATTPHYIRCIKPNPEKAPQVFVKDQVMHQLKCGGVMESVRICTAGFPTRRPLDKFYERYKILYTKAKGSNTKGLVISLMEGMKFENDKYKVGITKVFLRAGQIAKLEDLRTLKQTQSAIVIQKYYRGYYYHKRFLMMRKASIALQTKVRRFLCQMELYHIRRNAAAVLMQTLYRGCTQRTEFLRVRRSAVKVQKLIRWSIARKELLERKSSWAVSTIQRCWRGYRAKKTFLDMRRGLARLQAKWKGKQTRKLFVQMRQEARSVRSLQEAKSKLEVQLEELQYRLTAESRSRQHAEKEREELTKSVQELQTNNHKLSSEIAETKKKFAVSADEFTEVKVKMEENQKEREKLAQAKSQMEKKIRELEENTENLAREKQQAQGKVKQLTESSQNQGAELEILKKKIDELEKVRNSLKDVISNLESENEKLSANVVDLKRDNGELSKRVDKFESMNGDLKLEIIKIQEEFAQRDRESKVLGKEGEKLKEEINELARQKSKLEAKVKSQNDEIENLQSDLEKVSSENSQFKDKLRYLEEDKEGLGSAKSKLESKVKTQNDHIENLLRDLEKLNSENSKNRESLATLGEERDLLVREKLKLEAKNKSQNEDMEILRHDLEKKISALEKAAAQDKEEIHRLKSDNFMLSTGESRSKDDLERIKSEASKWEQQAQKLREENDRYSKELLEFNAKMQIEATKHELICGNMSKEVERAKMESDRLVQMHKIDEERFQRVEADYKDRVSKLEAELRQFSSLKYKFEDEFSGLKEKSSTATQETLYLKEVNNQLQQSVQRYEQEISEKRKNVEALNRDIDTWKTNYANLQLENQRSNDKIAFLEQAKVGFEKKKGKMKELSESLQSKIEQKNSEMDSLRKSHSEEISRLNKNLDDMRSEMSKQAGEIYKHQIMAQQVEMNSASLREECSRLRDENARIKVERKENKKQVTALQENVSRLEMKIMETTKNLEENSSSKQKEITSHIEILKEKTKEVENLRKEIEAIKEEKEKALRNKESEIAEIRAEAGGKLKESSVLYDQLSQARKDSENFAAKNAEISQQIASVKAKYDEVVADKEKLEREVFKLQKELENRDRERESSSKNEKPESAASTSAQSEEKMEEAFLESKKLKRKIDELQEQIDDLSRKHQRELENLKLDKDSEIHRVSKIGEEAARERDHFKKQIDNLKGMEETFKVHEVKFQQMVKENAEMAAQFDDMRSANDKLKMIELVSDVREGEWERLARSMGHLPAATKALCTSLLQCAGEDRTMSPIWLLYHQMQYWKAVELNNTAILQTVIDTSAALTLNNAEDFDTLTYLLSGTSFLLYMLMKSSKGNFEDAVPVPPIQLDQDDSKVAASMDLPPVKTSRDFFAQLKAIVGKCFALMVKSIASKLDPLLECTILIDNIPPPKSKDTSGLPSMENVTSLLFKVLSSFQTSMVHLTLSQHFFQELFIRINGVLLNGVLLRQQFCTENFGAYLKQRVEYLERWADEVGSVWMGDVTMTLQSIKQVAGVLVLRDKGQLAEEKHRRNICPTLNTLQLRQLLSLYTPGEYGKRVPIAVINAISGKAPAGDEAQGRILQDVNQIRPIPVKILHYFEVEDMLKLSVPPNMRAILETYVKVPRKERNV